MKAFLVSVLVVATAFLCIPALADSYQLVNFDGAQAGRSDYPFVEFYGGAFETSGTNTVLEACANGYSSFPFEYPCAGADGITIYVKPTFPVHEISFDLGTGAIGNPLTFIFAMDDFGNTPYGNSIGVAGNYHIDIVSPTDIRYVYIYDDSFGYDYAIDNVAFNPSLAPTGVTPEPPSLLLVLTSLFGAAMVWWRRQDQSHGEDLLPELH